MAPLAPNRTNVGQSIAATFGTSLERPEVTCISRL